MTPAEQGETYKRALTAGLLLLGVALSPLLPEEEGAGVGFLLTFLIAPAGVVVAGSAAWSARRGLPDWRFTVLTVGGMLLVAASLWFVGGAFLGSGDLPRPVELTLAALIIGYPVVAIPLAVWWFLAGRKGTPE